MNIAVFSSFESTVDGEVQTNLVTEISEERRRNLAGSQYEFKYDTELPFGSEILIKQVAYVYMSMNSIS